MTRILGKTVYLILYLLVVGFFAYGVGFQQPLAIVAAWAVLLAFLTGQLVGSIAYRMHCRKYILTPRYRDARYAERFVSGRGHGKFMFCRLDWQRCLWLAVTSDRLLVGLMFPFNLMFIPERFDFEYELHASDILAVTPKSRWFGSPLVIVRFRSSDGSEQEVGIAARDPGRFIAAVTSMTEKEDSHNASNPS